MTDDRLTYRVDEAAQITGLSRSTLYRVASKKELPLIKVCGRTLISRADLTAMIERMRPSQARSAEL